MSNINSSRKEITEQLFHAIEFNELDKLEDALRKGASPNNPSDKEPNFRPLEFAIDELEFECSIAVVHKLINAGADINAWDVNQSTKPIHHAMCILNLDCMRILLENGANPNIPSDTGDLPLSHVASCGELQIAQLLLDFGAGKTINEYHALPPFNPLVGAILNLDVQMMRLLLENGADPMAKNEDGYRARDFIPEESEENSNLIAEVSNCLTIYESIRSG